MEAGESIDIIFISIPAPLFIDISLLRTVYIWYAWVDAGVVAVVVAALIAPSKTNWYEAIVIISSIDSSLDMSIRPLVSKKRYLFGYE